MWLGAPVTRCAARTAYPQLVFRIFQGNIVCLFQAEKTVDTEPCRHLCLSPWRIQVPDECIWFGEVRARACSMEMS